jgi:hypothetical protein
LSEHFRVEFELHSNAIAGVANFTLSVTTGGFVTALDPPSLQIQPMQTQSIVVTGRVSSFGTHNLIISASNACMTLTASREITAKPLVSEITKLMIRNYILY